MLRSQLQLREILVHLGTVSKDPDKDKEEDC